MKIELLALTAAAAGFSISDRVSSWKTKSHDKLARLSQGITPPSVLSGCHGQQEQHLGVDTLDFELPGGRRILDFIKGRQDNEHDDDDEHPRPPHGPRPPHDGEQDHPRPPHGPRPPRDGPGGRHPRPPHGRPPHDEPPHRRNPHDQHDKTLFEVIESSKYFTKLYDLIRDDKHIVDGLNTTKSNYTFFAPTDYAFEKLEKHHHSFDPDFIKKALLYHLVEGVYPAGRVLKAKTLETMYHEKEIDGNQRIAIDINLRGVTLNYVSRVIYVDVFTKNGVLHALDALLIPPPPIYDIAEILPSFFSTFVNAAWKTGLVSAINETRKSTIFAPSNRGFAKLGPGINAWLFSKRGEQALTKLLKYHVVPNVLFYSDAVEEKSETFPGGNGPATHYEFDTLLEGKKISVDVKEFFRFKSFIFNGRPIGLSDIPAKNGVLQKLDGVILPYKNDLGGRKVSELSIDEFEALLDGKADENETEQFTILFDDDREITLSADEIVPFFESSERRPPKKLEHKSWYDRVIERDFL
ncbi:hypothetical protein PYCC9005_004042 [Savitreella phatthalungensis]